MISMISVSPTPLWFFFFFALTVPSLTEDNISGNKEIMVSGLLYKSAVLTKLLWKKNVYMA